MQGALTSIHSGDLTISGYTDLENPDIQHDLPSVSVTYNAGPSSADITPGEGMNSKQNENAIFHSDVDILVRAVQGIASDKSKGDHPRRRTYTTAKPYACDRTGCGSAFSSPAHLNIHMRRHNDEKPFRCDLCDKAFVAASNLSAHQETHMRDENFFCKLDSCDKSFSRLGTMKTHQNKLHGDTLKRLTNAFAKGDLSAQDHEIYEYFRETYKNINQGVKGRGKGRQPLHDSCPRGPSV